MICERCGNKTNRLFSVLAQAPHADNGGLFHYRRAVCKHCQTIFVDMVLDYVSFLENRPVEEVGANDE